MTPQVPSNGSADGKSPPPELPVTADRPAIQPVRKRRLFGVRLWLALMFAAIGILTGTAVYVFFSGSSETRRREPRRGPRGRSDHQAREQGRGSLAERAADPQELSRR